MDDIRITSDEIFLEVAKAHAAYDFVTENEERLKPEEIHLVWFSKVLQNYKAILVAPRAIGNKIVEVTYNGDKKEMYFDYYKKSLNTTLHLD